MLRRLRYRWDTWQVIRGRMIRETEVFLEEALRRPDRYLRIPAIPLGAGRFPRGLADAFWAQVLGTS